MTTLEVRHAVASDALAVADLCAEGYRRSSEGLLPADLVAARSQEFYAIDRVRADITSADDRWSGYLLAELDGEVVGAVGGLLDGERCEVVVLYLRWHLRGRGIGRALLDRVTDLHRGAGASEQWVTVTEGNEHGLPF